MENNKIVHHTVHHKRHSVDGFLKTVIVISLILGISLVIALVYAGGAIMGNFGI